MGVIDARYSLLYRWEKRRSRLNPDPINAILYICHGNICRSVFSEMISTAIFERKDLPVKVASSGLMADQATSSPLNAVIAARAFGVDLSRHTPRRISKQMIDESSVVLGMHYAHFKQFREMFPSDAGKFYLLKHYVFPRSLLLNIEDPFGGPLEQFTKCFRIIKQCVETLSDKLAGGGKGLDRIYG